MNKFITILLLCVPLQALADPSFNVSLMVNGELNQAFVLNSKNTTYAKDLDTKMPVRLDFLYQEKDTLGSLNHSITITEIKIVAYEHVDAGGKDLAFPKITDRDLRVFFGNSLPSHFDLTTMGKKEGIVFDQQYDLLITPQAN